MSKPKRFRRPTNNKSMLAHAQEYFSHENPASQKKSPEKVRKLAAVVLWELDQGRLRVCEQNGSEWVTHAWIKRAILNFFSGTKPFVQNAGVFEYFDKLTPKSRASMKGVRIVPGAIARYGSYIEAGSILMPSFINIGAYVGAGTMIDTWATVGSCAQIGKNVHLSGGVGIGGVLEPPQASPVIIEDGAFVGSRSIIVEGVRVGKEAVIGAGVTLTASTKIIDTRDATQSVLVGSIPERAVVIPGTVVKKFPAGEFGVPCALIIGTRKPSTDLKTSLNSALREYNVSV